MSERQRAAHRKLRPKLLSPRSDSEPFTPDRTQKNLEKMLDERTYRTLNLTDITKCIAPSRKTPNFKMECVGLEPKEGFKPKDGFFAEQILLGSDAAGIRVGPLFERIRHRVQVRDPECMWDFSDCVLMFSPSHTNGQAAHAQLQHKGHFVRGARTALACMKRGPTLFVTVSRNFHSWFLAGCPSPDSLLDRSYPSWCDWKGERWCDMNVLCTFTDLAEVVRSSIVKFGERHWMLLLRNPCNRSAGVLKIELQCVALARKLMWN